MRNLVLLSGYYDSFKDVDSDNLGLYHIFGSISRYVGTGFYHIVSVAALFASIIAIMVSGILLSIASNDNGNKLSEAKNMIKRVLLISLVIFMLSGILTLVQLMAPQ